MCLIDKMKVVLFLEKLAKEYITFAKTSWKKNFFYKLLVIFSISLLISLFWPLTLLATCAYTYNKIDKPLFKYLTLTGVIIITLPLSIRWVHGLDKKPENRPIVKEASCIGPDGKSINLSNEACEEFNNAWKNGSTQTTNETVIKATDVPKPVDKYNVVVNSQIVKKVDGKCRYFFDIRNKSIKPFEGNVTIDLFTNQLKNPIAGDTFTTTKPIESELGTSVYTDANTCPPSIHGENGIAKFKYTVRIGDKMVNRGEGTITDEFEDIDSYDF